MKKENYEMIKSYELIKSKIKSGQEIDIDAR